MVSLEHCLTRFVISVVIGCCCCHSFCWPQKPVVRLAAFGHLAELLLLCGRVGGVPTCCPLEHLIISEIISHNPWPVVRIYNLIGVISSKM